MVTIRSTIIIRLVHIWTSKQIFTLTNQSATSTIMVFSDLCKHNPCSEMYYVYISLYIYWYFPVCIFECFAIGKTHPKFHGDCQAIRYSAASFVILKNFIDYYLSRIFILNFKYVMIRWIHVTLRCNNVFSFRWHWASRTILCCMFCP